MINRAGIIGFMTDLASDPVPGFEVCGVRVDAHQIPSATAAILDWGRERQGRAVHLVNAGTLSLAARLDGGGMVEVAVADRGCGLSEEQVERLFTPFFTTKAEGMGMGLNICRSIIEYHDGRLWVQPNPGGGSVFRFTLPVGNGDEP